jgi:hypothetical protein
VRGASIALTFSDDRRQIQGRDGKRSSRLKRDGVDIVTVKELLGHTNSNCTMRYAHSK